MQFNILIHIIKIVLNGNLTFGPEGGSIERKSGMIQVMLIGLFNHHFKPTERILKGE
jgi:hypothetical protein